MPVARNGTTELVYETAGDPSGHPLLLVAGFTAQLVSWDERLISAFADAGWYAVYFDNRDVGLSSKTPPPIPTIEGLIAGERPPYLLRDMAADALAVMDAVGFDTAHVWGQSMGGMIVQTMAIEHPERMRSMISVMSTTGNPAVGQSSPDALAGLRTPMPDTRDAYIEAAVARGRVTNGPLADVDYLRRRAEREFDRCYHPAGAACQMAAIVASGDRTDALRNVTVPTTVIHGLCDPLIGPSGGEATAAAIPGARLVMLEKMGHNLPEEYWPTYLDEVARFL